MIDNNRYKMLAPLVPGTLDGESAIVGAKVRLKKINERSKPHGENCGCLTWMSEINTMRIISEKDEDGHYECEVLDCGNKGAALSVSTVFVSDECIKVIE